MRAPVRLLVSVSTFPRASKSAVSSSDAGSDVFSAFSHFADRFFLLSRHHIYRRHNLCRRCLMYHMSRVRNAAEGAMSYITMQLCGLLRFDKSIFHACNDGPGHLETSVGVSEVVGFRDHESRFDCRMV